MNYFCRTEQPHLDFEYNLWCMNKRGFYAHDLWSLAISLKNQQSRLRGIQFGRPTYKVEKYPTMSSQRKPTDKSAYGWKYKKGKRIEERNVNFGVLGKHWELSFKCKYGRSWDEQEECNSRLEHPPLPPSRSTGRSPDSKERLVSVIH